jgi:hypothetical protein
MQSAQDLLFFFNRFLIFYPYRIILIGCLIVLWARKLSADEAVEADALLRLILGLQSIDCSVMHDIIIDTIFKPLMIVVLR